MVEAISDKGTDSQLCDDRPMATTSNHTPIFSTTFRPAILHFIPRAVPYLVLLKVSGVQRVKVAFSSGSLIDMEVMNILSLSVGHLHIDSFEGRT